MQIRFGLGLRDRLSRAGRTMRGQVAAARMYAERHVLATGTASKERPGGRVLCYHSLDQPHWGVNDVSSARFHRQIGQALAAGFRFVPAAELARTGGGPRDLSITFDDGARSVLTVAAPILASYGIPFSLFVVSDWSEHGHHESVLDWNDVVRVADLGAEIGNHSSTHPDFGLLDKQRALDEIGGAEDLIFARTGIRTTTFAIPLGQSRNWNTDSDEAARELGYSIVYAQAEETRFPGTVARTFVTGYDSPRIFAALLRGRYDRWEEWV